MKKIIVSIIIIIILGIIFFYKIPIFAITYKGTVPCIDWAEGCGEDFSYKEKVSLREYLQWKNGNYSTQVWD